MYENPAVFEQLVSTLHEKEWVVYAKKPFATPENLIKYLGAYTHRVAISNRRIVQVENGMVTFCYKDRRDNDRKKCMTVRIVEFIRRFMMHLAPDGFMRMRHCGFLSNKNRAELVPVCKRLLHTGQDGQPDTQALNETVEMLTPAKTRVSVRTAKRDGCRSWSVSSLCCRFYAQPDLIQGLLPGCRIVSCNVHGGQDPPVVPAFSHCARLLPCAPGYRYARLNQISR